MSPLGVGSSCPGTSPAFPPAVMVGPSPQCPPRRMTPLHPWAGPSRLTRACAQQPGLPRGPGPQCVPGRLLLPGARPGHHSCLWSARLVLSLTDGPVDRTRDPEASSEDGPRGGQRAGRRAEAAGGVESAVGSAHLPVLSATSCCVPRDLRLPQTATYLRSHIALSSPPKDSAGEGCVGGDWLPPGGQSSGDPGSRRCGVCALQLPDRKTAVLKCSPALDVSWGAGSGTARGC